MEEGEDGERDVLRNYSKKQIQTLIVQLSTAATDKYAALRFISMPKANIDSITVFIKCCPMLTWLDVHSNYVEELPSLSEFQGAKHLRILNLHNNGVYRVQSLNALTGLRSLQALTLYNCPIAERSGYRHHVVNTVWTLKALDHFILSDQEIIEDANFRQDSFKPFSTEMRINLSPAIVSKKTFHTIVNRINYTFLHFSPVTILQRFIRGHLARKQLRANGIKVKTISCKRTGRNLLSPQWKLPKGEVEINYRRLKILDDSNKDQNIDPNFLNELTWPDLQENDLDNGVYGKTQKVRYSDPLMIILNDMKGKEISGQARHDLAQIRHRNAKEHQRENIEKRKLYQHDKEKIKGERIRRDEFLSRLSRSLDAARAVDAAYAFREKQVNYSKLLQLNNKIRRSEKNATITVRQFRDDYRLKAKERRNEHEIQVIIDEQKRVDCNARVQSVKEKVSAKAAKDQRIAWNKKNSQKFSEYYLKLEKELIRYNVQMNRNTYTKRRKQTMNRLKDELQDGKERMNKNQSEKLETIIGRNRTEQNKLDSMKRLARDRINDRAAESHRRIKSMNNHRTLQHLPIVAPI